MSEEEEDPCLNNGMASLFPQIACAFADPAGEHRSLPGDDSRHEVTFSGDRQPIEEEKDLDESSGQEEREPADSESPEPMLLEEHEELPPTMTTMRAAWHGGLLESGTILSLDQGIPANTLKDDTKDGFVRLCNHEDCKGKGRGHYAKTSRVVTRAGCCFTVQICRRDKVGKGCTATMSLFVDKPDDDASLEVQVSHVLHRDVTQLIIETLSVLQASPGGNGDLLAAFAMYFENDDAEELVALVGLPAQMSQAPRDLLLPLILKVIASGSSQLPAPLVTVFGTIGAALDDRDVNVKSVAHATLSQLSLCEHLSGDAMRRICSGFARAAAGKGPLLPHVADDDAVKRAANSMECAYEGLSQASKRTKRDIAAMLLALILRDGDRAVFAVGEIVSIVLRLVDAMLMVTRPLGASNDVLPAGYVHVCDTLVANTGPRQIRDRGADAPQPQLVLYPDGASNRQQECVAVVVRGSAFCTATSEVMFCDALWLAILDQERLVRYRHELILGECALVEYSLITLHNGDEETTLELARLLLHQHGTAALSGTLTEALLRAPRVANQLLLWGADGDCFGDEHLSIIVENAEAIRVLVANGYTKILHARSLFDFRTAAQVLLECPNVSTTTP